MESGEKLIEIITPEPTWSYAVSFDLGAFIGQMEGTARRVNDGFTIEIGLLVSHGHVGILLVGDDMNTPLREECMVPVRTETSTVMISVPPQFGARRLIFRNAAAGTRSQFKLELVRLLFVTAEWIS
jgi:hypothetical protein